MSPAQPDDRAGHHPTDTQPHSVTPQPPVGVRTRAVVPARVALIALGVLLLLAALVFIGLPAWLTTKPPVTLPPVAIEPPTDRAPDATYDPRLSVRERLLAEEAVADYLGAREALEARGASLWAIDELGAAEQIADEGELALAERDYPAGTRLYRRAGKRLAEIADRAEDVYAEALAKGLGAIEAADPAGAIAAFQIAAAIHPDAEPATRGLARAQGLKGVLKAMGEGEALERGGALEEALASYERAVNLDPAYAPAGQAVGRMTQRLDALRFESHMSRGLEQLARADWRGAEASFTAAARLRPGDPGAADGLAQAREGLLRQRITRLEERARSLESTERWQEALGVYDQLLDIDPGLELARSGRERSERLARLHARIDQLLADPDLLLSERARAQGRSLLAAARDTQPRGPRLAGAITRLDRALDRASSPQTVRLTSNGDTEVTIYRVGDLGSFRERSISLRPGSYTVVGSRPGYRDERRRLKVTPEAPTPTLHIACEEPV